MVRVPASLDPTKTALVLFDMLNDFVYGVNEARARHIAESGMVDRCVEIREAARAHGVRVLYSNSLHKRDGSDYGRTLVDADTELQPWPDGPHLMKIPPGIEGTPGAEIIPELQPAESDYVVVKHRWSAFAGTPLDILLRGMGIDTILLAGGSTDIGILATAYAARDLGYNLVILRDACQTHRLDAQVFCMERLFPRMARVMTVREATALLGASGGTA